MSVSQRIRKPSLAREIFNASDSYENRLDRHPEWALMEGSKHFEEDSSVFKAYRKLAKRLNELEIPFAVVGGLALFRHGFHRFTDDVDLLVTRESLKRIHEELEGLGYLPPHKDSKHLRDTELGVRIEFLVAGQFPGDGKPKPVAFPDPTKVKLDDLNYIDLGTLIELKLASGISNDQRMKDITDVFELIKALDIPESFAEQLNPYVREKFIELRRRAFTRYVMLWRNKWLTAEAKTIGDMVDALNSAAAKLKAMQEDGVIVEQEGVEDDYAHLVTTNPEVAKKYGMIEESELWEDAEESDDEAAEEN